MITDPLQRKAYDGVAAVLPFPIDPGKIAVAPGLAYTKSRIKAHDFAAGVMGAFGSVVEHIGRLRGLPEQTLRLDRRKCGLLLNSGQLHYLNGYGFLIDLWPIGPDNGTYRTSDGRHVTMIGLHPQLRDALLAHLGVTNSATAIQAAVEKRTAQEIEDDFAKHGLPAGMLRSLEEWLSHPQGAATAARPWIDIEPRGDARKRSLGPARHRPLEGVRVLELTHLVAGPTVGRLLAEQGADVIKVQPPVGQWVYPLWMDVGWGKRNIMLDVKSRSGRSRFAELLAGADVLVNSLAPGALDRMGLGVEALSAVNPNLVLANISYASAGTPWADRKGFEQIAQSVTGIMHITSEGLASPSLISVLINDYMTGYFGAIGVVAALAEREVRGGFWTVGAALARCATAATTILADRDDEPYAPVTMEDMAAYAIDQDSPVGTFTRVSPAVEFSVTPSMAVLPPSIPGSTSDTAGWLSVSDDPPEIPHRASATARNGDIRGFLSTFGIEDRGDGGGMVSLASKSLLELAMASRLR